MKIKNETNTEGAQPSTLKIRVHFRARNYAGTAFSLTHMLPEIFYSLKREIDLD